MGSLANTFGLLLLVLSGCWAAEFNGFVDISGCVCICAMQI
jgi:hypothetical protein